MNTAHNAHHWGIKAAQAGLPPSSNPFISPQTRAAWRAGYQQMLPLLQARAAATA